MKNRLKELLWGPPEKLGRVRQALVKSILSLAILGGTAIWAQPQINKWRYPPPPVVVGACTNGGVFVSGAIQDRDKKNALKWVGMPETTQLPIIARTYNPETKRTELWFTDNTHIWLVEIVCFDNTAQHWAIYGAFEKYSWEDFFEKQAEIMRAEQEG